MKAYFLSAIPSILTINDAYFGICDTFERFAEISLKDNLFVQFTPQGKQPICFFLNEQIIFTPPTGCKVYVDEEAITIYAYDFPPSDYALQTLGQIKEEHCLVTLFLQGRVQLSIQTKNDFCVCTLLEEYKNAQMQFLKDLIFIHTPTHLTIFTKSGVQVFDERIASWVVEEDTLKCKLPLGDSLKRIAVCEYSLLKDGLKQTAFSIIVRGEEKEVKKELIPYAFLESIVIGGDYAQFLNEQLKEKSAQLPAYLGVFEDVLTTDDPYTLKIVKKQKENLYTLKTVKISVKNDKIEDIQV